MGGVVWQTQTGASNPCAVAESADGTKLYIAQRNNTFLVVNALTGAVISTLSGVNGAFGMTLNNAKTKAYVNGYEYNCVYVINLTGTPYIEATIAMGMNGGPGIAINPTDTKVYATNVSNSFATVIDTATNTVTKTIPMPTETYGVEFSPDGQFAYFANSANYYITIVNAQTDTVIKTSSNSNSYSKSIVFHPSGSFAFVLSTNGVINTFRTSDHTLVSTISTGISMSSSTWNTKYMAITKNGKRLYVGSYSQMIYAFNVDGASGTVTTRSQDNISTGTVYYNDTLYMSKKKLYVVNYNYNWFQSMVLDTAMYGTMAWGGGPVTCEVGDLVVGILVGTATPTTPTDCTLVRAYTNSQGSAIAVCYKIAKTTSESISWGGLSSMIFTVKNASKIGSYAVGDPGGYGFYSPNVAMTKTDGTSLLLSAITGFTHWNVSLQPGDGISLSTGWSLSASVRNSATGAGGYFYTAGGAPSISIAAITMEIIMKDPAKTGFYFMFN